MDSLVSFGGDEGGLGYVVGTDYVVRDPVGNYWLGQYRDMIKIFDSAGRYLRTVGRAGSGPMEFSTPLPVGLDHEGGVRVVDPGELRETIISPDFALDTSTQLPVPFWSAAALPERGSYVINGSITTPEAFGLPLHIVRGGQVVQSFGGSDTAVVDLKRLGRVIAVGADLRVYTAYRYLYSVDIWDTNGNSEGRIDGPSFPPGLPQGNFWSQENPPRLRISGMTVDEEGLLWVVVSIPRSNWRSHMVERRLGSGRVVLQPANSDDSSMWTSRIDVFDLSSDSLIAQLSHNGQLKNFVAPGYVFENRSHSDGTPRVVVWQLALASR